MTVKDLLPHERRVIHERGELAERLLKLSAFATNANPTFAALGFYERADLSYQKRIMEDLLLVLDRRIERIVNELAPR